jgi:hypothetical protein
MRSQRWLISAVAVVLITSSSAPAISQTGFGASRITDQAFAASVRARMDAKRAECISAIGSLPFCNCLAGDLPVEVDFLTYIAITTSSVSKVYFDQLSPDDQRLTPRIQSTRDRCVAAVFGAQK